MSQVDFVLHTGLTKTGSTTLQEALFPVHPDVHYVGKRLDWLPGNEGCRSAIEYRALRPVLFDLNRDAGSSRTLWENEVKPNLDPDRVVVGSWESIGNQPTAWHGRRLERLRATFDRPRILYVLRNPITHMPSDYLQQLKGHAVHQHLPYLGKRLYFDIDQWYERTLKHYRGLPNYYPYAENIRLSVRLFGEENVGVLLFEGLQEDSAAFHSSVCRFMGIDVKVGLERVGNAHIHKRMREHHLNMLRQHDGSWIRRVRFRWRNSRERRRVLKEHSETPPARPTLTPEQVGEVSEATRRGNQWLREEFGLPLERFGYPL